MRSCDILTHHADPPHIVGGLPRHQWSMTPKSRSGSVIKHEAQDYFKNALHCCPIAFPGTYHPVMFGPDPAGPPSLLCLWCRGLVGPICPDLRLA